MITCLPTRAWVLRCTYLPAGFLFCFAFFFFEYLRAIRVLSLLRLLCGCEWYGIRADNRETEGNRGDCAVMCTEEYPRIESNGLFRLSVSKRRHRVVHRRCRVWCVCGCGVWCVEADWNLILATFGVSRCRLQTRDSHSQGTYSSIIDGQHTRPLRCFPGKPVRISNILFQLGRRPHPGTPAPNEMPHPSFLVLFFPV